MNPTEFQEKRHYEQEFERRSKAMPFHRFVAHGEPLPTEQGNVDKLVDFDGTGTWYFFPDERGLKASYGGIPEDPTLGQEASGAPLHHMTGRGEKYAGGNVETEMVADEFKNPQGEGDGSQTGGTGIQRAQEGDGAAIGSAIEAPDVNNAPTQHPDQAEAKEAGQPGTGGPSHDEAGQTGENDVDTGNAGATSTDEQKAERTGGVRIHRGLTTDTAGADAMKQGEKTATDETSEGAVTASHSAKDLEETSPGVEATDTGEVRDDQGEGTELDTEDPTANGFDVETAKVAGLKKYLDDNGVDWRSSDDKPALQKLAREHQAKAALAIQKSDEAAPTTGGGVMTPADGVNTDELVPDTDDREQ